MRFLADENFPSASTDLLREMGHDVTAVAADYLGVSDEEVLARAAREERIVLPYRDYGELIYVWFGFGIGRIVGCSDA